MAYSIDQYSNVLKEHATVPRLAFLGMAQLPQCRRKRHAAAAWFPNMIGTIFAIRSSGAVDALNWGHHLFGEPLPNSIMPWRPHHMT